MGVLGRISITELFVEGDLNVKEEWSIDNVREDNVSSESSLLICCQIIALEVFFIVFYWATYQ